MDYFNNLEKLVNISPDLIYKWDGTNITDDSGAKTVICRCWRNRAE